MRTRLSSSRMPETRAHGQAARTAIASHPSPLHFWERAWIPGRTGPNRSRRAGAARSRRGGSRRVLPSAEARSAIASGAAVVRGRDRRSAASTSSTTPADVERRTSCRRSSARGVRLFDFDGDGRLDIYLLTQRRAGEGDEPAVPQKPATARSGRDRRLRARRRRLRHGRRRRRRRQRRPARCRCRRSTAACGSSSTRATARSRDVTAEAGFTTRSGARPPSSITIATAGSICSSCNYLDYDSSRHPVLQPLRAARLLPAARLPPAPGCTATSAASKPRRHVRGRDRWRPASPRARPGLGVLTAPTSTATAGPTSSSPTTASRITCGSISTTARSRRRR